MAGIIVILLVVLLSPLTAAAEIAGSGGKIRGSFSIIWLMFHIRYVLESQRMEILILRHRIASLKHKDKPDGHEKPGKTRLHMMQIKNMIAPLFRLVRDIIAAFRLKYLDIDITYGLKNPAYTGIFTGFLYAVRGLAQTGQNIRFSPDYARQVLDWNMKAKISTTPVQIVLPMARFVTNIQVLKSASMMIRK
ncbi:MAG: DUF2953 domain-containing protein [Candidatus Methanoperedens sp.]|nr:DUF2953 domain-containing protein [Candidatus Methanoperedens sp.]